MSRKVPGSDAELIAQQFSGRDQQGWVRCQGNRRVVEAGMGFDGKSPRMDDHVSHLMLAPRCKQNTGPASIPVKNPPARQLPSIPQFRPVRIPVNFILERIKKIIREKEAGKRSGS